MEFILWLSAGLLFVWVVVLYNLLIQDKSRVLAAWSDIDVQLKRRHDLLPKLVDTVNVGLEVMITGRVRELITVAESCPDLKASRQFVELMHQLSEVESHTQFVRRYYNGAVRNLNIRIDSFPSLVIARLFRFQPNEFFQLESATEGLSPMPWPWMWNSNGRSGSIVYCVGSVRKSTSLPGIAERAGAITTAAGLPAP
jgi:LemA protein